MEAANRVKEGFMPLISKLAGFVEYYWVDLGQNTALSVSVFKGLPNAIQSNEVAANWVKANLAQFLPKNPRIESGKIVAHKASRAGA
jgi:hypothetical protein